MREITFIIEEDQTEGGYTAHAHDPDGNHHLFTEGDTRAELLRHIREVIDATYSQRNEKPDLIRLQFVRDETIPVVESTISNGKTDRYPLRGTVLRYVDPLEPACPADEWEALR